jgi:hypothetical protein
MRLLLLLAIGIALTLTAATRADGASASGRVPGTQPACVLRAVAGATNQAGLVVKFDDGRTLTYCIEFTEESITGLELLRRSGLSFVTASNGGLGAAVCSIDSEGCSDPGNCFCQCAGGVCEYWAYFRAQNGAWQYSPTGAGARTIRNGDSDAWIWGGGGSSPGGAPADCALVATATPDPTSTPAPPTRTVTPRPSRTPTKTAVPATSTPPAAVASSTSAPIQSSTALPPLPFTPAAPVNAPTSDVRGAAVTPAASPSIATAVASSSVTTTASPSPTQTAAGGVIRVSDEEGDRNAAATSEAGAWEWSSTLLFAAFALLIMAAGAGALIWRTRAGGE